MILKGNKTAIQNIKTLAIVLGPEETRSELLKNITELIEEKEVILELLKPEIFTELLHFAGGTKHIKALFEPLESLCTRDDQDTRNKALETIKALIEVAQPRIVQEDSMEICTNLMNGEWYTSKIAGISIAIYLLSTNIRDDNKQRLSDTI